MSETYHRKSFRERLGREWLFWDGGMGSLLQEAGLTGGELPESWNLKHPDVIRKIHANYLAAGCHIINTNTFGANRLKYPDELKEIVEAGVDLAVRVRDEMAPDAYVALDIGPTGRLLAPYGDLSFEEAVSLFAEVVRLGKDRGVDLILIETMSDSYEAKAAVLAAKENTDLPVVATMVFDGSGKLLTGGTPDSTVPMLEGLGVEALGVNCGLGPEQMLPLIRRLNEIASVPIVANPNAGLPRRENGRTVYDVDPESFAEQMMRLAEEGLQLAGGCCGTTPEYIRLMTERLSCLPFKPNTEKNRCVVTSFAQAVCLDGKPVMVGERLNPTAHKALKQELLKQDLDTVLSEGLRQEDEGAQILDVNAGLPEADEPALLEACVKALQSVTALPLQLDSASPAALERALRIYNGKAVINSVTGKKESMEAVFPLAARYGGVVIGLPFDEGGIPKTAEGRLAVARKIIDTAESYGIRRKDILIDGLTLTVAAEAGSAAVTLETVRRIREQLGVGTVLGVSNISFGLPRRELINASFLSMALFSGLNAAIVDSGSQAVQDAFRASAALLRQDEGCQTYIRAYKGSEEEKKAGRTRAGSERAEQDAALSLETCVIRGLADSAAALTEKMLQTVCPEELIDSCLIPALGKVGEGYEKGTLFLPQLLMSAEAAKASFEVIKRSLPEQKEPGKGPVLLATVKGDIHDIGKNIVKVMLENYGYEVLDLGRDVAPERIVKAVKEKHLMMVGLSALMTTTVVSMEETIRALKAECPWVKIAVGGAVLTGEYADQIGADRYCRDAMGTVRYADEVFGTAGKEDERS